MLSVDSRAHGRHSAVLASLLLQEELGHTGRVGCALCLIGSFIIVLHAPEDKEITTVDEILHYAVQPGAPPLVNCCPHSCLSARFPLVLLFSPHLRACHDILRFPTIWHSRPISVHFHLLTRRLHLRHGHQRVRSCAEAHSCWEEPTDTPEHVCLRHCRGRLHPRADELLQ